MSRPTITDIATRASPACRAKNACLLGYAARQDATGAWAVSPCARESKRATGAGNRVGRAAPYGRCQHTGRPYRSKTEAQWAAEHRQHEYERLGIRTACGVYWPDFVCGPSLYEIKGGWIRDRALHKVKAALSPARALGFDGIWLAQWDGKRWSVRELQEG